MQKKQIVICLGSSCYRRGNKEVLEMVKNWLKENDLEKHTVFKGELCTGNCDKGPVIKIDGEIMYVNKNSVIHILEKHFANILKDNKNE